MLIYQQKARQLADEILRSEISLDYGDAFAVCRSDPDDPVAQAEFLRARAEYQVLVESVIGVIRATTGVEESGFGLGGGCGGCCGGQK